ncbi:WD domain, G-beta repeat [Lacunisphaera limnophila]|uniref:WD domain, G-beta repeat n=1 Tax=Lacunisphaera limnophila TaxID=1838286 RepID=A0A1D8ARK3_9BACT|nr:WD40 repeat domain-containing protein [Lacunisphaera limnophila]AOS43507.1 WD domain, G-beta repeat [Lacunisphaera limnophila]
MNFAKHWAATLDDYAIDLAWSPDGTLLAAASAAGGITLFDAATGAVRHQLPGHADGANCLAWSPAPAPTSLLATGGQDGCVRFWDALTGRQTAEVKIGPAWVEHLCWFPVGSPLAGAASDAGQPASAPRLFAAAGKKLVALHPDGSSAHAFPDAPKTISALSVSPSSVLAAAYFGGVCTWDATTFTACKEFPYGNAIYALTWSPDSRWLVAGCHDNAVHLWAPAEADLELHMSGYETRLKELSFSHDSKWLATGGGRDACVWDCAGAGPEGREPLLLPHDARVCAVAFQHAHSLLATGSANGQFTLWMPSRKNPLVAEVTMPSSATKFAWRADDAGLAVGTEKGQVFVFKTT